MVEAVDHASGIRSMREAQPHMAIVGFEARLHRPSNLGSRLRAEVDGIRPVLLVVSARALPEDRETILASGFDAFHANPILSASSSWKFGAG